MTESLKDYKKFDTKDVSHDYDVVITSSHPFGRFDAIRVKVDGPCRCSWCDNHAKFHYGMWGAGLNENPWVYKKAFCSIGCYRSFYAVEK